MKLDEAICREHVKLLNAAVAKIHHCLHQLKDDQIWWRPDENTNSIGNLLLHVSGNLRQWGIVPVTGEPDVRDRRGEFDVNVRMSREELIAIVAGSVGEATAVFSNLDEGGLLTDREVQGFGVTVLGAITHTTAHFVGHVHQIILLTRLQLGRSYEFHWTDDSDRKNVPI